MKKKECKKTNKLTIVVTALLTVAFVIFCFTIFDICFAIHEVAHVK